MDAALTETAPNLYNVIVQPFPIHFDCNDYHVMLFFKNHPEYESIEAMIREPKREPPFIRIIITHLDGKQVDHINNRHTVEAMKIKKRKREIIYTPIHYEREEKNGSTHIVLNFNSFKGENIVFDFHASGVSSKYAHLIDPGQHSKNISLPVMYPERTTLAGPKSSMAIDGVKYKIPVQIRIPLLFKKMKGYYSEIFNIAVFRTGRENIKVLQAPLELKVGEKWVCESGGKVQVYEISEVKDNILSILKENEAITAEISDKGLKVKKLSVYSSSKENDAQFSIEFTPSLPLLPVEENAEEVDFSISIDNHTSLITGKASAKREGNKTGFLLTSTQPEWAAARPVSTVVEEHEGEFVLDTQILN